MAKRSLLLLPILGAGHLHPMMEMARRLLRHLAVADADADVFGITVLTVQPHSPEQASFIRSCAAAAADVDIGFHALPPVELPANPGDDVTSLTMQLCAPHVKAFIAGGAERRVAALVVDLFATAALDAARELALPTYVFVAPNAAFLALTLRLPALDKEVAAEFGDMEGDVHVPGMPPIPPTSMPVHLSSKKSTRYTWLVYHGRRLMDADGIIVNTAAELEPRVLAAITEGHCTPDRETPPVYAVGPVIPSDGMTDGRRDTPHECIEWLDKQTPASVVFLCFGSMGSHDAAQVRDMAAGLERSGHRFLWVLRAPPADGSRYPVDANLDTVLPAGFMERTKERGMVWPSWAPQKDILSHVGVGGFVTHCGWNSTLESLWHGVPMAAWPLHSEQHLNAFEMATEMGVAVELKADTRNNNFVAASELERAVRCLMGGSEEGRRVRERAQQVKLACRKAVQKGGSSDAALRVLAEKIRNAVRTD